MSKRPFRPEDAYRLKTVTDPDLSPDGRRVAFVVAEVNEKDDRLDTSIWVAPVDGSGPERPFTEGPSDRNPRWSPDGRWLAYISVTDGDAQHSHIRLAPLDGGSPRALGDLPGPVIQLTWSPDSRFVAFVCRVGLKDRDKIPASERNAPRQVRGLAARLDGIGWQDGRRHVFVVQVEDGSTRQLTRGDYDHADPAFSPDSSSVVCASDRHPRRDDRQFRADVWVVPVAGGRPRRLTDGKTRVMAPIFSPDGTRVAFAGMDSVTWNADSHLYVTPADGRGPIERVAPDTDLGIPAWPGLPAPFAWTSDREVVMTLGERGGVVLHRARVGDRRSRPLVVGDVQIDGLSARLGRRAVVYTATWPDAPSEVFAANLGGGPPVQLSHLNDAFGEEVELVPVGRSTVTRPDGAEVEYFTLLPPGRTAARRLPLHLDIHGGPHGFWPAGRFTAMHQAVAAAGYAVVLPNPRGSTSYGQEFTAACTGDWGGADYEDILACCDDLVGKGVGDRKRMFVTGGSYGGFMTAWIVGHTDRFRAAAAVAAVIDQTSMALTTDIPEFALFNMGGTPWSRPDTYLERSPLSYLERVTTPVLVIHWEGDIRVPMSQGEELYSGLRVLGKKAELLRYPGGFHVFRTPSQAVDWARRLLAWNKQHDVAASRRAR